MSIKFSQFTNVSSISSSGYIVGYDGSNNVRIKTSTSDSLFAFTGGSLQFSKLTNAMVPTNTIGLNKLVNLAGLSVLGNATNASAAMAAITAANDNEVLLRSGTSLVFSKIGTDNINNAAVTFAKMQDITPQRFVGRNSFPAGPAEEVNISQALEWLSSTANTIPYRNGSAWNALTAGTNGYVLRLSGGALGFGQIDYTSVSFNATQRVLGRNSSGAGTAEELTIAQVLDWLSSTANTIAYRNNTTWTTLTAGSNAQVLRLSGGSLGFGQIDYASISFGATQRVLGRKTAGAGTSEEITASDILDFIGSTQGQVLYRGASGWTVLGPGTSGQYLKTLGAGADPSWDTVPSISDGDKGDITVSLGGTLWTIDNGVVTYAKIQNVSSTSRVLGRKTSGAGTVEELTTSELLDFLGNTQGQVLYRGASGWSVLSPGTSGQFLKTGGAGADPSWDTVPNTTDGDKGDITVTGGGTIWTIDNGVVTYPKMQNVSATSRILGRKTAGAGTVEELTTSELLDFVGSTRGQILYRGASGWVALGPGTSGQILQTNGAGADPSWVNTSGGGTIGGSTGATDNSLLRADGTGGSTLQNSDITIDDATTTTQANVTIANTHSGQTNSSLVLSPKGTGAFIVGPKPNGASSGGNSRGTSSIDLQVTRTAATQVASGNYSVIVGGENNTASALHSVVGGQNNTVSAQKSAAFGASNLVSKRGSFSAGENNTASGDNSAVFGSEVNSPANYGFSYGFRASATLHGQFSGAGGRFATVGDCQRSIINAFRAITGTSATGLTLDGGGTTMGLPATNSIWGFTVHLVAVCTTTGGSITANDAFFGVYRGSIKRVGATASLVGTIDTVATKSDGGFVANAPTVDITASGTTLDMKWTTNGGNASTVVRVNARLDLVEIGW